MSSSRLRNTSTMLIDSIKRIHHDCLQRDFSTEQISTLTEKIYQIWINSGSMKIISNEGYQLVEYLEQTIREQQTMCDQFIILITCVLGKNTSFFHAFLIDHQHFQKLFQSSISKSIHLLRYLELLYFYCPLTLIDTVGQQFYRFSLHAYLLPQLRRTSRDIDWFAAFCKYLSNFHDNSSKSIFTNDIDALDFCKSIIETFLHHSLKTTNSKDFLYDLKLINTITKVLSILWQDGTSSSIEIQSIEHLFLSMFNSSSNFSSTILAIFSRIHLDAAEITVKTMFNDGRMTGERLFNMIKSLIEMIDAPIQLIEPMPYDTWLTGLCTALISFQQDEFLLKLIDQTTTFLVDHLFNEKTFENALQILFWFIRYDKRIETFLIVLNRLPNLFERFHQSNDEVETKLVELCHMAVTIHSDYDLTNETRLKDILRRYPHPDLNVLSNHRYIHDRLHSIVSDSTIIVKHRVGIINHGNTCYVSSVLQALYQCDLFRKYILEHRFDHQSVLRQLQIVFAQLNLSKRSSISPMNLIKVARPVWFNNNEQQDCAEFLGYLLDTIKDEEKKEKILSNFEIERLFTIRTSQINRCQRCSKESSRDESSNYLFLPIPTSNNYNQSAMPIIDRGLKFYPASNRNSQTKTFERKGSTSSIRSQSPPPSYNSPLSTIDNDKSMLNLQNIFDSYFQKEELKDENQYRCEFCRSLQDAERYIILQSAPEYLILSLNRFEYDKQTNIFRKIFTKMNYPKILNVQIHTDSLNKRISIKYCLILVIVHTGYTLHSGHYYVYAREIKPLNLSTTIDDNPEDYFTDDEWFLLNDDQVTVSSYQALIDNCANYTSATPYILFYRRIDAERIEMIKQTSSTIHLHPSLTNQIEEDNQIYRREQEK